jgi:hypothetical protein
MGQVSIKYTNTFYCKTLQNLPKFGFLVRKQTIWQPWYPRAAEPMDGKMVRWFWVVLVQALASCLFYSKATRHISITKNHLIGESTRSLARPLKRYFGHLKLFQPHLFNKSILCVLVP